MVANCVTKATGLCFLDDGIDWSSVRLTGEFYEEQEGGEKVSRRLLKKNNPACVQVNEETIS